MDDGDDSAAWCWCANIAFAEGVSLDSGERVVSRVPALRAVATTTRGGLRVVIIHDSRFETGFCLPLQGRRARRTGVTVPSGPGNKTQRRRLRDWSSLSEMLLSGVRFVSRCSTVVAARNCCIWTGQRRTALKGPEASEQTNTSGQRNSLVFYGKTSTFKGYSHPRCYN